MKKSFIIPCVILLIQVAAFGQKELISAKSKADLFSEKTGTLVQRETTLIGSLKSLDVKTMVIKDLLSNTDITAVRLETVYVSSISRDTKIGTFDKDEIDAVLKTLSIIKGKLDQEATADYTEVTFKSRGGVSLGCFTSGKKKDWSLYLRLEEFDGNSYVFLKKEDIGELENLMTKAKANL
jgi:hypothetical protein